MRFAGMFLLTAILLCTGYWFFAARMIERQSAEMLARNPMVEGMAGPVSGFPFRFRSTVQALEWRSRDGLRAFQADAIVVEAASYQPNRIHLRFPAQQDIGFGGLTSVLQTRAMLGAFTLAPDLALRNARLTLEDAEIEPAMVFETLRSGALTLQHSDGPTYTLTARADALELAPDLLTLIDPNDTLPDGIDTLRLSADLRFDAPISAQGQMPDLMTVQITDALLDWGPLQLRAEGQITRSTAGAFDGQIALRLQDWRPFHALLIGSGALPQDAAMMASLFLASLAEDGGSAVTLPLEMRASVLSLGPFALMRLPTF